MITAGKHTYVPEDVDCYSEVELKIGSFCSIGSGLKIYSGTHACIEFPEVISTFAFAEVWNGDYPKGKTGGKVTIGNDVWIATDVKILEGVTIEDGAIIGAGSLVTSDVDAYSFVAGNPARIKKYRVDVNMITKLLTIKWWLWDDEKIKRALPYMKDANEFIKQYG